MIVNNIQGVEQQQPIAGARANGGPVQAGQPYLVGENGPEVVVPSQNGTVVPNHQINHLWSGPDAPSADAQAATNIAYGGGVVADQVRAGQDIDMQQAMPQDAMSLPDVQTTDPLALQAMEAASQPGFGQAPAGGGGMAQPLPVGDAGKVQMMRTAQEALQGVEKLLYNQDGSLNRLNLAAARVPGLGVTVPGTDGQMLATQFEQGIQAITRMETGAAMAPSEIENTRTRFQPGALDSEPVAALKLKLFKGFVDGSLSLVQKDKNGNARFDDAKFNTEFESNARQYVFSEIKKANPTASDAEVEELIKKAGFEFTPEGMNKLELVGGKK
jgi:hypothetical protein